MRLHPPRNGAPGDPGDTLHVTPPAPAAPAAPATSPEPGAAPETPADAAPPPVPPRPGPAPAPLDRLNAAAPEEAERALLDCCGSTRWARRLVAHRPYPDPDALLAAADEAGYDMTPADLSEALTAESSHHPLTRGPAALAAHTALRAAHAAYEARFGHAFVVSLASHPPEERLDQALFALRTRLGHTPEREREVVAEELRLLARERLTRLLTGPVPVP
ncbi:2-oxo-4-hydroxy-4-carboxy-5-ureidoimidazoline decarboxylase [Streptomyces sp. JJ36]|uniref:2-oxo-4-hydroxy-4-carboxy-5-ureidoimidazoline decarboxylase n=1 Tax=Streptomyces sp. JJ36 TaxID=2736645 RepID=UPI001F275197|nr:2-oxo-4-hydroxy-4-carboxy-5-ureidoimidazoline decarboxylase [Streptomyces sp. JJ36]MCF6526095.1 2-oxo-4-hydroxy-4-carboxy-5-ureidoimidazoline decarboxylase [Streptomyces sp. JJ36]